MKRILFTGKPKNMRDVPYSITQDFIAVYRLHPLMPDTFNIRNHLTGAIGKINCNTTLFKGKAKLRL